MMCVGGITAQTMITGQVMAPDGECIGATIVEQDKGGRIITSTVTDFNGNFSLQVKNVDNMLKISDVGYKTQVLPIKDRRRFVVTLKDDSQTIAEV